MVKASDIVVDLSEVDRDDVRYIGRESADLGEMIKTDFPVPGGFVITAHAYFSFVRQNRLKEKIDHLLGTIDYEKPDSVSKVSGQIRRRIQRTEIPQDIIKAVFSAYTKMGKGGVYVAIRPSTASSGLNDSARVEYYETFLNVRGEAAVIDTIRRAWASYFNSDAVMTRHENKHERHENGVTLIVQRMIDADVSGRVFTVDPVKNDKTKVVLEAIFGRGEHQSVESVSPDRYEVEKKTDRILTKKIVVQDTMLVQKGNMNVSKKVSRLTKGKQKISDLQIKALTKLALRFEKYHYFPQEIEWVMEKKRLYIIRSRPMSVTGSAKKELHESTHQLAKLHAPYLVADPASPGIGVGMVKVVRDKKDLGHVRDGDILVTHSTDSDFEHAMKKAGAIIAALGGHTSHTAVFAREFGIPAVVGATLGTTVLQDGRIVTVNGTTGDVFSGSLVSTEQLSGAVTHTHEKLRTHIYTNLAKPGLAQKISTFPTEGVGPLRSEYILTQIGVHPKKIIEDGKQKIFASKISDYIKEVAKSMYPKPVMYRISNFTTDEYRTLTGGKHYEPLEENPLIGYRGAFRYVREQDVLRLELEAIRKAREEFNNISVIVPFVRTGNELRQVKEVLYKFGLKRSSTFKILTSVEVPSAVILVDEFIKIGVDGLVIDLDELTMLTLGLDRGSDEIYVESDELNPSILWSLERVVKAAKKNKIACGVYGQSITRSPELIEELVGWGVTSISVPPGAIMNTRDLVMRIEKREK